MSRMLPKFPRMQNGDLRMGDSKEAAQGTFQGFSGICQPPEIIQKKAKEEVRRQGGDPSNKQHVLGQNIMQFGRYRGQSFKWMLENCLGYAGWLVDDMRKERLTQTVPLSVHKHTFKEYVSSFPEGIETVDIKRRYRERKTKEMLFKMLPADEARKRHREEMAKKTTVKPNFPPGSSPRKVSTDLDLSDEALAKLAEKLESRSSNVSESPSTCTSSSVCQSGQSSTFSEPTTSKTSQSGPGSINPSGQEQVPEIEQGQTIVRSISSALQPAGPACPIVESWKASLPEVDIPWISRALFSLTVRGKPELDDRKLDKLWFYPPTPQVIPTTKPKLDRYFGHRLFLWMPNRILKMKLMCPNCNIIELTRQGPYRLTRMVLDIDDFYILAGEWLHCSKCKKNWISWSDSILDQLDPGTKSRFPIQILYKTACDNRVIFLLHQRGLGNSPSLLQKKISELHNTNWTTKKLQYLTDCKAYARACINRLVVQCQFDEPPKQIPVPKYQWFIRVYCQEVKQRLEEVKASITSVFGKVLKMDSTKKLTKKLSGEASRTAGWATSISNEHGQVLQCVLTYGEGEGLVKLVQGIIDRYRNADVPPPTLLYVDSHCCGKYNIMDTFRKAWPDLNVRLDVWHFMRRLATCVTTDTHRLYAAFMGQLSHAIFQWDQSDLALLKTAKRSQLIGDGIYDPTEQDILDSISRKEMALHCRRRTRGTEETIKMLRQILEMFDGDEGRDTMGVPLFHRERIWEEWRIQQNHVDCLQDPADMPLYTKTGTLKKGHVELPTYRCARGSTSLESFHLHLARFIPGTSANANNFQAYLLEGLMRWNEDRAVAATSSGGDVQVYSARLRHVTNKLSEDILGKKVFEQHKDPQQYTGELLGMEYLFDQTGKAFGDEKRPEEEPEEDDTCVTDEGFEDAMDLDDPTIHLVESFLPSGRDNPPTSLTQSPSTQNVPSRNVVQLPSDCDLPEVEISAPLLQSLKASSVSVTSSVNAAATVSRDPNGEGADTISQTLNVCEDSIGPEPDIDTDKDYRASEDSVGPDNVGGYSQAVSLAEYLYQLVDKNVKVITNAEAERIVTLWTNLEDVDKSPTKFRDRYKPQLIKGRFKAPKQTRTQLLPGVQSVKRCALAPHLGPATWPDSNRYQEALISKLCLKFPSSTSKDGRRQARWNLVITAYNTIREMIFNNPKVMRETKIQLPDISHRTLTAWFSARGKRRERETFEQGLNLPLAPAVAQEPLPAPLEKPGFLTSGMAKPLQFTINENTSGMRKKARRQIFAEEQPPTAASIPISILPAPSQNQPLQFQILDLSSTPNLQPQPSTNLTFTPSSTISSSEPTTIRALPYSTKHYQKRKMEAEMAGDFKRKYIRKADVKLCGKCGQDRKKVLHQQYYGHIHCPTTSDVTYEQWVAELKNKGVGKKKGRKEFQ